MSVRVSNARVPLAGPDVGEAEAAYMLAALRSGSVGPHGPDVDAFEHEIAELAGTAYGLAVSSGTAALHLALLGLGVGAGQVVLVPTLTFVATANAVVYTGAEPVFVDCRSATGNVDVDLVEDLLTRLEAEGRRVGAIMAVDMFGVCADYPALTLVAARFGVPLVEDAAESLGATRDGRCAGSFGTIGAFSFNANKIVTTSGGGMLVSDDAELMARCRYLATQARQPVEHYEHTDIGYNYRLSNLLAAFGRAQLGRLDATIARRRQIRDEYGKVFARTDGARLLAHDDPGGNCWLTTVIVEESRAGWTAAELREHLRARDIDCRPVWKPMHLQPIFAGARSLLTGAAEGLFDNGVVLPSGNTSGGGQMDRVFETVEDFVERPR